MYLVTPSEMRLVEKTSDEIGTSFEQLMLNAGQKLCDYITEIVDDKKKPIVFLCGNGNNGGDSFVAGKKLSEKGYNAVIVLMCGDPKTELSAKMYCELGDASCEVLNLNDNINKVFEIMKESILIVDSIFGTGFHGDLQPEIKSCFLYAQRMKAKKLAVDVPSGGNCISGEVADGTLKCDFTVTFAAKKLGMTMHPLIENCGEIYIADIGIRENCFELTRVSTKECKFDDVKSLMPERKWNSHKGDFGKLLIVCGSDRMSGAAAMSTLAALRSGVGICTLASTEKVTDRVGSSIYETMLLTLKSNNDGEILAEEADKLIEKSKDVTAVLIGCGLGNSKNTKKLVEALIKEIICPIILDADGINCIVDSIDIIREAKAEIIITPHTGEFGRLLKRSTEEVSFNRYTLAKSFAEEYKVTIVAKGSPTVIVSAEGNCYVSQTGNAGLSRGGSGDILAGMIASFTAQGLKCGEAAMAGVYLHGLTADRVALKKSMQGMLVTDVIDELPLLFKEMNI